MFAYVANMENAFVAMFAFTWLYYVVLLFIEMGLQMGKEERAFDVSDLFVIR